VEKNCGRRELYVKKKVVCKKEGKKRQRIVCKNCGRRELYVKKKVVCKKEEKKRKRIVCKNCGRRELYVKKKIVCKKEEKKRKRIVCKNCGRRELYVNVWEARALCIYMYVKWYDALYIHILDASAPMYLTNIYIQYVYVYIQYMVNKMY